MNILMSRDIFKACRILFGPEIELSQDFLDYLQSSGIKSAYRKRARETHPDMAVARVGSMDDVRPEDFHETHWAYERLIEFIGTRDSHHARRAQPMRFSGQVVQPRRHRHRRRARRDWAHAGGYFYRSAMPRRRLMLGEYLFYSGKIPWEALIKAIVWQRRQRPRLGEIASGWGWLSDEQILMGFRLRRLGEPIGRSLLRQGLLSESQQQALVRKQRTLQMPIGEYFVANGYLTASGLNELIRDFNLHNEKY